MDIVDWLRREAVRDPEIQHVGHSRLSDAADEIERLRDAKRRALQIADERAKENNRLRAVLKDIPSEQSRNP